MSSPPRNLTGDVRARNEFTALSTGAFVASSMRSNPVNQLPLSPQASSPTSITPVTTATSLHPVTSSAPVSQDVIKLSALYQSSRRSRSSGEKNTELLPASTLNIDLLPPPPLHSVNDDRQGQKQQLEVTSTQQDKTFDTMMSMHGTSSSSPRMRSPNSSSFSSSNSKDLETNPPMSEMSTKQRSIDLHKDYELVDEMVWTSRHNSDEVIAEAPHSNLTRRAESTVTSTSALSDDVEFNQVSRRLTCDDDEEARGSDANGSYFDLLMQPPSKKSKLTGSNEGNASNDSNTTTTFQCSKTMSKPPDNSDNDDDGRMSPVTEQVYSGDKEEEPRRSSLTIEDLEEDQRRRCRMERVIDDSQDELIQRKIERLLLIRHCTKCSIRSKNITDPGYFCPVTSRCAEGKALCAHIKKCKRADCTYKKCLTTREVLGHYMKCRDASCKICGPVRSRDKRRRNQMKDDIEWRHANMLL